MSTTTLDSLQAQVNTMLLRLAVLDGQGLTPPTLGFVQATTANFTGLSNDIDGSALALEELVNNLTVQVQTLQAGVNQLAALSGITITNPAWVTPPFTMSVSKPATFATKPVPVIGPEPVFRTPPVK
jgi:hypothetical protein